MTHRQTETSREIRLWIGQVVVPIVVGAAALVSNREARNYAAAKYNQAKEWFKSKTKK